MTDMAQRIQTALKDRYRIERQIGEGGMATVYLAEDLKHHRQVAIKVFRPELAAAMGSERFHREIEIAAQLSHPHILPLHDSGEADGLLYYVMPFVEGESLADKLRRDGRLSVKDATTIAREVGSALDYAHRRGLVHRDIKPANILLSEGHAVVADFGIARAVSDPGTDGLTQVGMAVGSPGYMSPEQATAERDIDGRTDIYALGCVLFEMLSGQPPFTGETAQSIIAQAISAPIPDLEVADTFVPQSIRHSVGRALQKNPKDRFETASAFVQALEYTTSDFAARPTRIGRRSAVLGALVIVVVGVMALLGWRARVSTVAIDANVIAVLPFNATGANVAYLGEGMVDLLSTNLNSVGSLRTIDARTVMSLWRRRGGETGIDREASLAVGRDVHAGAILLGSVVEAGTEVRLNAELIDVNGAELARAQVQGPADGVLGLVDSLSVQLLRSIWSSSEPMPSVEVASITTGSVEAIRAFLRGQRFFRAAQWDSAIASFHEATAADSTFALAHVALGQALGWSEGVGSQERQGAMGRALRFRSRLPPRERMMVNGYSLFTQGDPRAIDTFQTYVQRYPSDALGWQTFADVQYHARHVLGFTRAELLAPFRRSIELDSSFVPSYIHPLELGVMERDANVVGEFLGGVGDSLAFKDAQAALFGADAEASDAFARLADGNPARFITTVVGALRTGGDVRRRAIQAVRDRMQSSADSAQREQAAVLATMFGAATGQLDLMNAGLSRMSDGNRAVLMAHAVESGLLDASWRDSVLELMATVPYLSQAVPFYRGQMALALGDVQTAREVFYAIDSVPPGRPEYLYEMHRGWLDLLEGDTTQAVNRVRRQLRTANLNYVGSGSLTGFARLAYAEALAMGDSTHARGVRLLRNAFQSDMELLPQVLLTTARVLERAGDIPGALEAYGEFVELWSDASPELQDRVQDVRNTMARLSASQRD